jgi:DNA-binding NtrC family response regulator
MTENPKILLADDDPKFQKLMRRTLEKHGFEVMVCNDGNEAKTVIDHQPVELIISDYVMPNMNGVQLLKALRDEGREIPFILITAYGSIDTTMEAIKLGTVEYLTKPFHPEEIILAVQKALNMGHVKRELSELREAIGTKYNFENMIGKSPSMQEAYRNIHKASQTVTNVLITGETGTGKELAARAIHYNGLSKNGPFIPVNCSAFSGGTLESELFGHVKGAFTDAHRDHKGRFELADQGTLFLDEVCDIPLNIQVKLLRAATNQDLKGLVKRELFREDLFYRLSVINITMPPLREHPEDIPLLTKHFLKQYTRINKKDIKTLSLEAMKLMQSYTWPGNVRQLENAIESAVAMCEENMIKITDLPLEMSDLASEEIYDSNNLQGSLPQVVAAIEKQMIEKALHQNEWIKARAAKTLGISERVMSYKMDKYGIVKK